DIEQRLLLGLDPLPGVGAGEEFDRPGVRIIWALRLPDLAEAAHAEEAGELPTRHTVLGHRQPLAALGQDAVEQLIEQSLATDEAAARRPVHGVEACAVCQIDE